MCSMNLEYQLINPTTQVALFTVCIGTCDSLQSINWQIYYGLRNDSNSTVEWTPLNSTDLSLESQFFGRKSCKSDFQSLGLSTCLGRQTSNFTATNELFLQDESIEFWRFEVVYTFTSKTSSSALNFQINQPPTGGSCSIDPSEGTTSDLFAISCPDWVDENKIQDYSLYGKTSLSNSAKKVG